MPALHNVIKTYIMQYRCDPGFLAAVPWRFKLFVKYQYIGLCGGGG